MSNHIGTKRAAQIANGIHKTVTINPGLEILHDNGDQICYRRTTQSGASVEYIVSRQDGTHEILPDTLRMGV